MTTTALRHTALLAAGLILLAAGDAASQARRPAADIGVAAVVQNQVDGTLGGTVRRISQAAAVFQDEQIKTAGNAKTQLLFKDETVLTIGPSSELTLDRFVYDNAAGTRDMVLNLSKGVFRFVSGSVNSQAYTLRTPTTSIGVRGTIFDVIVEDDGTTWVILREGAVDLRGQAGLAQRIDRAGLASSVARAAAPTPPAPPPPAIARKAAAVASVSSGGAQSAEGGPTDIQGLTCGVLPCRDFGAIIKDRCPRESSSQSSSSSSVARLCP